MEISAIGKSLGTLDPRIHFIVSVFQFRIGTETLFLRKAVFSNEG